MRIVRREKMEIQMMRLQIDCSRFARREMEGERMCETNKNVNIKFELSTFQCRLFRLNLVGCLKIGLHKLCTKTRTQLSAVHVNSK